VYRAHQKYVEKHVPGGLAAVEARLSSDGVRSYLQQRFDAAGWYDIYPLLEAGEISAALCGVSLPVFLERRTKHQVQEDQSSVYRYLLRFVSEGRLMKGVAEAVSRYFDFVETREVPDAAAGVCVRLRGVPESLAEWLSVTLSTYFDATLALGGRTLKSRCVMGEWRAVKQGVPVVEMVVELVR
jgi:hypothetical protein